MTRQSAKRRATSIVLAAVAIGITAPAAGARPFDGTGPVPVAPPIHAAHPGPAAQRCVVCEHYVASPLHATSPAARSVEHSNGSTSTGGDISNIGYVAIGSGAATFALVGVGGTLAVTRRRQRRRRTATQSTITA